MYGKFEGEQLITVHCLGWSYFMTPATSPQFPCHLCQALYTKCYQILGFKLDFFGEFTTGQVDQIPRCRWVL